MVASPPLPRRFEVVRELGAGGSGLVLEAIDRERAARIAIKIMHAAPPIEAERERVQHEFTVAAAVTHPNLVRLGELHELAGGWGFSMELIDGPGVVDWVRRDHGDDDTLAGWGMIEGLLRPRFLEGRLRTALGQIAGALAALHGAGIVHRGLRPPNLRVDRNDRVVVLDLALATLAEARGRTGDRPGTIEYRAPEDVGGGRVTTASDLYALGAVLFEIVTGRPPFVGASRDVALDKLEQPAPRASRFAPELARDLDELCARLLDRDPARRPSAADVAAQFGTPNQPRAGGIAPRAQRDQPPIGRDAELAALAAALEAPAPLVQVVHGPAGIGKTVLLDRVARDAARRGFLVCAGPGERARPRRYGAWDGLIDGVARFLAGLAPDARAAFLPDDAGAISYLSESFARVIPARPSWGTLDELTARGFAALRTLLHRLCVERRVVAIVDEDDEAGARHDLGLLAALMRAPAPAITIFLGVGLPGPELTACLAALPVEVRVLEVGPLAEPAARALAERLLGAGVPGASVLAARSGGNPLFVEQLARFPHGEHAGPAELIAARYAGLVDPALAILRMIAAARGPLRQDVLGSALGLTHRAVSRELGLLADGLWVRSTGNRRNDLVELAHGLVAAAIRTGDSLATEHALLAAALDNSGLGDDDDRLGHWTLGGDLERAGALAIAMVGRARDAHDFTIAGVRCDAVLAMVPRPWLRASLLRARGDARLGIGDAGAAADDYLAAADAAEEAGLPDDALDARRLAAEHLVRSGRVERGFAVAHAVAQAADIDLAMSADRMIGKLMVERARARLRGTELPAAPDLEAARLADVCLSLAAAFSMIDMMRAAWFTSRGVRAALDSGDPRRIARALAVDSCVQVARGGPGVERARRALALAERLIDDDPRERALHALLAASRGATAFLVGDFAEAVALGDEARARYRTCSPQLAYEARAVTLYALTSTAWLGRWADAARRAAELERDAIASGDRHAEVFALTGYSTIASLAGGADPGATRDRIAVATQAWPRDLAPAILAREVVALAVCDLYQERPDAARTRLRAAWTSLDEAYLLHVEHLRAALLELSARAAIRCGELEEAGVAARRLAEVPWAAGPSRLLQAAIAAHYGRHDQARALLAEAATACAAAGLAAHAVAAADRRARLDDDDAARAAAQARARELGLGDLERALRFLLPWP